MFFPEKLDYLMKLTSTSNKQLATALSVDASLVSRIRTGKRGAPRNPQYREAMAAYFARRCTTDYQLSALAETIGNKFLKLNMNQRTLSDILYNWLSGGPDKLEHYLFDYAGPESEKGTPEVRTARQPHAPADFSFFGSAGKRDAVTELISGLFSLSAPLTVYLFSDECLDWAAENVSFFHELKRDAMRLLQKGFKICRIVPPGTELSLVDQTFRHWAPLFFTGNVVNYYYPKLRDDLHRRTMVVIPNHAALVSSSEGPDAPSRLTMLTFNTRMVAEFVSEFNDYLDKCVPILIPYEGNAEDVQLLQCLSDFWGDAGNRIYKGAALSAITTPIELLRDADGEDALPYAEALAGFEKIQQQFARHLLTGKYTEILRLPAPEEIRRGRIPITASCLRDRRPLYYSAKTFRLHLTRMLALLEQYENYHVILREVDFPDEYVLMTVENYQAWLRENKTSSTFYKIREQHSVGTCRQYLEQFIDTSKSERMARNIAIDGIRDMVALLDG